MPNVSQAARRARLPGIGLAAGAALLLAACGSSTRSAGASGSTSSPTSAAAGVTIGAANVAGYGMVLVDGHGRTLYMLTSERGGKITCNVATACTEVWPDIELPAGVTAAQPGSGIDKSLLGTVKDKSGHLRVTYGGWPLYTFSRDKATGQAAGEGINSFGGTWYVLGVDGKPVTSKTTSGSSGSPGYGGY